MWGYFTPYISDCGVRHATPLDVVCNNQSPALIYGGYLPWTVVYCGAWHAPGAVSTCCKAYVLAVCICCCAYAPGAVSTFCIWHMLVICVYCVAWSKAGAVYVLALCIMVEGHCVSGRLHGNYLNLKVAGCYAEKFSIFGKHLHYNY